MGEPIIRQRHAVPCLVACQGALSTCHPALLVVNSDIMPKKCTTWATLTKGYTVAQLGEALRYKPEGRSTYTCVNGKVIGGG